MKKKLSKPMSTSKCARTRLMSKIFVLLQTLVAMERAKSPAFIVSRMQQLCLFSYKATPSEIFSYAFAGERCFNCVMLILSMARGRLSAALLVTPFSIDTFDVVLLAFCLCCMINSTDYFNQRLHLSLNPL